MTDKERLESRIKELTGWSWRSIKDSRIVTDTSDWSRIKRGDIMRLGGRDFLVKGNLRETRFGIGDQPKYWVFSAIDMETEEHKIIKTVFHEDFYVHIGVFKIHCYRSVEKEGFVLSIVEGDDRFMHGYTVMDEAENRVRVLEFIKGKSLFNYIYEISKPHEQYYHEDLPAILSKLLVSLEAISFLHQRGTCHGDIRNDHIIIDSATGNFRWIDFDLNQHVSDFDVWSLGNIICYAAAKGIAAFHQIRQRNDISPDIRESLRAEDASAFFEYRIMNVKKLYPYLSDRLSDILLHFTVRPKAYYANCDQLIEDYKEMLAADFS